MKKVNRKKKTEYMNIPFAFMGNKEIEKKIKKIMKENKIGKSEAIRLCIEASSHYGIL